MGRRVLPADRSHDDRVQDAPGRAVHSIGYGNGGGETDSTFDAQAACNGAWSGYCNPEVDTLLDTASATIDPKERERLFRRITQMLIDDVAHVILWQAEDVYGLTRKVAWKLRNDDRIFAWEIDLRAP